MPAGGLGRNGHDGKSCRQSPAPPQDEGGEFGKEGRGVTNVITGAPAHRSPYFNLVERAADGSVHPSKPLDRPIERRQDAPACFDMNASIYVWRRDPLVESAAVFYPDTLLYEMPVERSFDIDSELDFELVEFLMKRSLCA